MKFELPDQQNRYPLYEIIKNARKARGLTQHQMAHKLGLTYQQIQKYENGRAQMTIQRTIQICELLQISIFTMFPNELHEFENNLKKNVAKKFLFSIAADGAFTQEEVEKIKKICLNELQIKTKQMNKKAKDCVIQFSDMKNNTANKNPTTVSSTPEKRAFARLVKDPLSDAFFYIRVIEKLPQIKKHEHRQQLLDMADSFITTQNSKKNDNDSE